MPAAKFALLLMALPLMAACGDKSGQPASTATSATPAAPTAAAQAQPTGSSKHIAPPKPGQILATIYQKDVGDQDHVSIANGSEAEYWYGHAFELNGKHYFTGFAYDTPDKFGKPDEVYLPAPDAKVTLTEATFAWDDGEASPAWTLVEAERYIGEFGGYEKADSVDDKAKAQSVSTADGRLLLAVPTWVLASGTQIKSFDLFVYRPEPSRDPDETAWTYVGDVSRGEDNGAACDADGTGNHMPCVSGAATLSFVPAGSGLPDLRVALTGTGIDASGQKKTYGASDVTTYRFNPQGKVYEAVK